MVSSQQQQDMCIDIECGAKSSTGTSERYYSDAEEEEVGSCYSQFYSDDAAQVIEDCLSSSSKRASSVTDSDCSVIQDDSNSDDVVIFLNLSKQHKKNSDKKKNKTVVVVEEEEERDCRICHLSLRVVSSDYDDDHNNQSNKQEAVIELGCCCKDDLAVAHKHCALTWFNLKGNKTCEICNSIVSNLVLPNETPQGPTHHVNPEAETTSVATSHLSTRGGGGGDHGCINGHRLLNFILACLVFAFVISWLFHFNIPS